jgi:hypothetical protein
MRYEARLISLWLYKENNNTYGLVVLTSSTHPRKILLVVLQIGKGEIGKAKDFGFHEMLGSS